MEMILEIITGVNYVELLESAIQSDGAVHFENENGFWFK